MTSTISAALGRSCGSYASMRRRIWRTWFCQAGSPSSLTDATRSSTFCANLFGRGGIRPNESSVSSSYSEIPSEKMSAFGVSSSPSMRSGAM